MNSPTCFACNCFTGSSHKLLYGHINLTDTAYLRRVWYYMWRDVFILFALNFVGNADLWLSGEGKLREAKSWVTVLSFFFGKKGNLVSVHSIPSRLMCGLISLLSLPYIATSSSQICLCFAAGSIYKFRCTKWNTKGKSKERRIKRPREKALLEKSKLSVNENHFNLIIA